MGREGMLMGWLRFEFPVGRAYPARRSEPFPGDAGAGWPVAVHHDAEITALKKRIQELERRIRELEER